MSSAGDPTKTGRLRNRARILVQQLINQIKAPPFNGVGHQSRSWRGNNGETIHAMVNMVGLAPIIRALVESPMGDVELLVQELHVPGIVAFIPASGAMPQYTDSAYLGFGIGAGVYTPHARRTYASPYLKWPGTPEEEKVNGLLGTEYSTTIQGREGDHRERKPAECGWLADWDKKTGEWTATRGHTGYFGIMNWIGKPTEAELNAGKPRKDIVSWDGPRSRYAKPSSFGIGGRGGRVYHRLRILCDLLHPDYKPDDIYSDVSTVGAAIHHDGEGAWLYQAAYSLNVPIRIFKWKLAKSGAEDEKDEFDDRYVVSQEGPPELIASIDLQEPFMTGTGAHYLWEMKTGFFFNESGTRAVCTIGTVPMSGSEGNRTYLVKYSISGGVAFDKVFDSTELEKDEGGITFPLKLGYDNPQQMSSASKCVPYGDQRFWYVASGASGGGASESDSSEYKLKSFTQVVCADYAGDSLVYLYYTNPETVVTQTAYSNWSGTGYDEAWPVSSNPCTSGKISHLSIWCDITSWDVGTRVEVKIGDRRFHSSDGKINWSGGACDSLLRMDGDEDTFLHAIDTTGICRKHCATFIPNPSVPGMPAGTVGSFGIYLRLAGTGWAYNNPAECKGQRKNYNIDYLDLRFGLMTLQELSQSESAMVDWRMDNFPLNLEDMQKFRFDQTQKFIVIDGSTVVEELEYENISEEYPIGIALPQIGWNMSTGFGVDYWWRMNTYYIPRQWQPEVSSSMNQWWDSPAKAWCAPIAPNPPWVGNSSMLRVNGDLIYSIPYAYENADSLTSPVFKQASVWGKDTNPQQTFFEIGGDDEPPQFYLANLSLI
jgi:hypothetical protein